MVAAPVREDQRYVLEIDYSGTPEPVDAPTAAVRLRRDRLARSPTTTRSGRCRSRTAPTPGTPSTTSPPTRRSTTSRCPCPAPVDRASRTASSSRREDADGLHASPAGTWPSRRRRTSSTLAFGDYEQTELEPARAASRSRIWTPRDDTGGRRGAVDRAGRRWTGSSSTLGPYPFDTFGILVVDSAERHGDPDDGDARQQRLHAVARRSSCTSSRTSGTATPVTPDDWRDVWMNEGMAMYLQGMWEAEQDGITDRPADGRVGRVRGQRARVRRARRPTTTPTTSGSGNIYYGPALMWHELRQQIGDDEVLRPRPRAGPRSRRTAPSDRESHQFFEKRTGEELPAFFDAWLLGEQTPPRD